MITIDDYFSDVENQWCPGCSNFGILQSFKKAMVELNRAPHQICLVSGIGQAAKFPHYLKCNFFNGLHGRALPIALGIHSSNPDLTTIVVTGDGDCYGEGGNHFIHTLRRNPDITVLVHNNEIYALTKGQASPTTPRGEIRTLQIHGVETTPMNMPAIAILHGCTFVARGFAGDPDHLKEILVRAVKHKGFSYVDVVQPCITWGKKSIQWYRERVSRLGKDYDPKDKNAALKIVTEQEDKIPTGVIYQSLPGKLFAERFRKSVVKGPLVNIKPVEKETINQLLREFMRSS